MLHTTPPNNPGAHTTCMHAVMAEPNAAESIRLGHQSGLYASGQPFLLMGCLAPLWRQKPNMTAADATVHLLLLMQRLGMGWR